MKLALVDDHALLREGLVALLSGVAPDCCCLQFGSLAEALVGLEQAAPPDLILLDLGLPDVRGLDALARLREVLETVPQVVVSADERPETVMACLEAGASGFIAKTSSFDALWQRLLAVTQGRIELPEAISPETPLRPHPQLSPRQAEVLDLLLMGLSNKAIARTLNTAESTIKTHLSTIFDKLGVTRRAEVMVVAAQLGYRLRLPSHSGAPRG